MKNEDHDEEEEEGTTDEEKEEEDEAASKKPSRLSVWKLRCSLLLGTLCIASVFVMGFLIPMVLLPSVATLAGGFVEEPVTCKVLRDFFHASSEI